MVTIGVNDAIFKVNAKIVTVIEPVTAGLFPDAGHVAIIVIDPIAAKYMLCTAVPVVVVTEVVPDIVLPPLSLKTAVQVPVNNALSSPLSVAVIVKVKFADGVRVLEARVMVYA